MPRSTNTNKNSRPWPCATSFLRANRCYYRFACCRSPGRSCSSLLRTALANVGGIQRVGHIVECCTSVIAEFETPGKKKYHPLAALTPSLPSFLPSPHHRLPVFCFLSAVVGMTDRSLDRSICTVWHSLRGLLRRANALKPTASLRCASRLLASPACRAAAGASGRSNGWAGGLLGGSVDRSGCVDERGGECHAGRRAEDRPAYEQCGGLGENHEHHPPACSQTTHGRSTFR